MTPTLIAIGTFVGIALVVFQAGRLLFMGGRNQARDESAAPRRTVFGPLTRAFAEAIPVSTSQADKLRKDLGRAGYYQRSALDDYLAMRNAAMLFWILFVGVAVIAVAEPGVNITPQMLLGGGIVLLLIYAVPRVMLSQQAQARTHRIQFALPDAIDMINMMVVGGLPLRQSLQRVSAELKETHPDVACELAIVDHHTRAGSLEQALKEFAKRIDVPDVVALATLVRHAERLGGNVATAFRDFADGIRRSRRQRAEERGNKATVQMLFPVIFLLAPPIYVLLLGPAALELRDFVARENRPGGALSPNTAAARATIDRTLDAANGDADSNGQTP